MHEHNYKKLNREEIFAVLRQAPYCRLAVAENDQPYLVPMQYRWKYENGRLWFLLYSAERGEKMRCMHRNNKVALEFEVLREYTIDTVVAKGRIVRFAKDTCCCADSVVAIEILATTISGCAYQKCAKPR
ncbi:MAG: pyridoxamine 5'-phosphate oxidase family protein [Oscillospiraceae bacterium]|nr:pyridoxamine 5'-phosphate oxidase family protein [Oscillospiraceae bacterium]